MNGVLVMLVSVPVIVLVLGVALIRIQRKNKNREAVQLTLATIVIAALICTSVMNDYGSFVYQFIWVLLTFGLPIVLMATLVLSAPDKKKWMGIVIGCVYSPLVVASIRTSIPLFFYGLY
ncbi:MAG: hypothetical protein AAGA84_11525 [Pseudomonadota bacterium]